MGKNITSFVGLDVHQDSTAIGVAEAGRESPRFLGTVGPDLAQLLKALKSLGKPDTVLQWISPWMMILVYGLAGFGYIVTATYLYRDVAFSISGKEIPDFPI